jgi:hypothetical protein
VDPACWQGVAAQLSVLLHGSPVAIDWMPTGADRRIRRYASRADPERAADFFPRLVTEAAWTDRHILRYTACLGDLAEDLGETEIDRLELYQE